MQTPRLCIDGRAASDFSPQGSIAQDVIDQLASAQGEPEASELVEKKRTVLLSHPDQVFSGQLKRYDTTKKIGGSFLYWAWEKNFVETSSIGAFHRFRPVDRLEPQHLIPTVTTVLPPLGRFAFSRPPKGTNHFVVPSKGDSQMLQKHYRVAPDMISVVPPTVRRFAHFTENFQARRDGWILVVTDGGLDAETKRLMNVLEGRFPRLAKKVLSTKETGKQTPEEWLKLLQNTSVFFYLNEKPFDWPFLFLEAIFLNVPTIFSRKNAALAELVENSPLELSRYLADLQEPEHLLKETEALANQLREKQAFDPLGMARAYRGVYEHFREALKLES